MQARQGMGGALSVQEEFDQALYRGKERGRNRTEIDVDIA